MSENTEKKITKHKGPIRWNAIIPFLIVSFITYIYFVLFFDLHMKNAIEWVGYKALGAEVNVGQFKSSFVRGNVQLSRIQVTNKEKPELNSIELADVRFDLNWDALLRVKFVIEEIAVEGVQLMSKRARPGKVAPPEPPSGEPSITDQLTNNALNKLDKENQNNVLGDVAQFLKTGKFDDQIQNVQGQLASKKLLEDLNTKWTTKKTEWDGKIKSLPTGQDLAALKGRFEKIKFKDFSSPQELESSLKEADAVLKEINAKTQQVQDLKTQFDTDIKSVDQDYKSIDKQIKADIDTLKSRFKIPKIDAASFAKALFMDYLKPYTAKLDRYRAMAQEYLPPKYARMVSGEKTKAPVDESEIIQPHPREKGVVYEFPVKNGYPLFWIQKVQISSKSNSQVDFGDFKGLISNITSNQAQIGRPTTVNIEGSVGKLNINGIQFKALFNNIPAEAVVQFDMNVGSYPIENLSLIQTKDGNISIPHTNSSFTSKGEIIGFKNYDIKLANNFNEVDFKIEAPDKTVSEILNSTLGTIKKFDLQASMKGEIKNLDIDIRSSLAGDLESAFQNLLKNKIKEANEQLQKAINAEVDKLKNQLTAQVEALKTQAQNELKKVQAQIDDQKKQAEEKINQAKKDFDDKVNKAKKDAEDQAKEKLKQEGQKKLDELKKGLGL